MGEDTALLTGTGLSLTFEDDIALLYSTKKVVVIPYSMVLILHSVQTSASTVRAKVHFLR